MQRTITEQTATPTVRSEPEVLRLIRADPRIRSVAIIRPAKPARIGETQHPVTTDHVNLPPRNTGSFLVTDLIDDITYLVGQEGGLSKLVFAMKGEQVIVAVQSGSDLTEIAHDFAVHLDTIMAHN